MSARPSPLFTGCAAALITPFTKEGIIDSDALKRLIRRQDDMDALIVLGTTGEPCSLTMTERELVIRIAVEESSLPVIVGTGSNDTRKAIEFAKQAAQLGAAGQLAVTPYYNKTTQAGLIRHYSAILDTTSLPMILYNVPSRTGMSMTAETAARLAEHPNVAGLKDASADLALSADVIAATDGRLPVYSGNDDLILPLMAMGAVGAISVAANVVPMQMRALTGACLNGCLAQAQSAHNALLPMIRALFLQVSPIPVKAALSMMGLIEEVLRLPLTPMENPYRAALREILQKHAMIPDEQPACR